MHTLIASKLPRDPSLLSKPRQNLENWSARAFMTRLGLENVIQGTTPRISENR
jgi:hypothetical protein